MIGLAGMVGSSPPVRGTFSLMAHGRLHARLIPARAGNIHSQRRARPCPPAHPHSRREHAEEHALHGTDPGPSPLTRGTHTDEGSAQANLGFIPAHAGNIQRKIRQARNLPAHLRSRGEHGSSARSTHRPHESSPLARGTLATSARRALTHGLIPARAGNTNSTVPLTRNPAAHPRSRGEHKNRGFATKPPTGSSPLARGTPAR